MAKLIGDTTQYNRKGRFYRFLRVVDQGHGQVRLKEFSGVRHSVAGQEIVIPKDQIQEVINILEKAL